MYFIRLIMKEKPVPQRRFAFMYLCFVPDDGHDTYCKKVSK